MEQSSSSCSYSYSLSSLGESSDNNKYTTDNIEEAIEEMESSTKEFMNRQREELRKLWRTSQLHAHHRELAVELQNVAKKISAKKIIRTEIMMRIMDNGNEKEIHMAHESIVQMDLIEEKLKTHPRITWLKEFADRANTQDPFSGGYPSEMTSYLLRENRELSKTLQPLYIRNFWIRNNCWNKIFRYLPTYLSVIPFV